MKQQEEEKRASIGRSRIEDSDVAGMWIAKRTGSGSRRAYENTISVDRTRAKTCKKCGHNKFFHKPKGVFCTKCGGEQ